MVLKHSIFFLLGLLFYTSGFAQTSAISISSSELEPREIDEKWAFVWDSLIPPRSNYDFSNTQEVNLATLWNEIRDENSNPYPSFGFATYRILLKTTHPISGLGISLPDMYSAYALYLNGKRIASNGMVGTTKESSIPHWLPQTILLPTFENNSELLLHVSNFHHSKGGVKIPFQIGNFTKLQRARERILVLEGFLSGVMILGGLVLMSIFFFGKRDMAVMYFGLFCLIYSYRIFGTGLYSLHSAFPNLPWSLTLHFEYLSLFGSVLVAVQYLRSLYPQEAPLTIYKVYSVFVSLFVLATLISPPSFFTQLVPPFFYSLILFIGIVIFHLVAAKRNQRIGAGLSLISVLVMALTTTYAMLSYLEILDAIHEVVVLGYLAFFFLHSSILASRFSYRLKMTMIDAEKATHAKNRFLESVTHELRTPLNSILGYAEVLSESPLEQKQKGFVNAIKTSGELLLGLVNDVIQKSSFELKQIELAKMESHKEVIFNEQRVLSDLSQIEKSKREVLITALEVLDLNFLKGFSTSENNPSYIRSLISKSLVYKDYDALYELAEFIENQ